MQASATRPIVVAGGGLAGLSCALALADAGLPVTLVEREPRCGGRAASWQHAPSGAMVDTGPHVVASEYRNLLGWLERLGTRERICWQREPLITLFDRGRAVRMPRSRLPAPLHGLPCLPGTLRCVGWRDLWSCRRIAWQVLRANGSGDTLALDGIAASDWLRELGASPRIVEWFWTSAALAILNLPLAQCSAAALLRLARLLAGVGGAHFGFPAAALATLTTDPALAALHERGARVLLGTSAERLLLRDGRVDALVLAGGQRIDTDCCVLAVPPQAFARLAPAEWQSASGALPARAAEVTGAPYVSSYLWFDRPLLEHDRFWARTWSPADLNTDFYELARIRDAAAPIGAPACIACNAIDAVEAGALDDAAVVRRSIAEIAEFAPHAREARILHAAVHRIPMAIPRAVPGFETLRPPTLTPFDGLLLAGDWTATGLPCSMESAVRSGFLAADLAAERRGVRLALARPVPETGGLAGWLRRPDSPRLVA